MKKFYIAVTIIFEPDEKRAPEPGYHAFVMTVSEADNIKSRLDNIGGLVHANICFTKKQAYEVVNLWNDSYRANGTHLFASPILF